MKKELKFFLKKNLYNYPKVYNGIEATYYNLRNLLRKSSFKWKMIHSDYSIPSPETKYFISPKRIKYHTNYGSSNEVKFNVFDMNKDRGTVKNGDWDQSNYSFSSLPVYKGFLDRIKRNIPWEETDFYQHTLNRLQRDGEVWGCKNQEELSEHFHYLDELISSIKKNGYKSISEIEPSDPGTKYDQEVTVNISRNGKYLFQDGRHRLSIAKILDINEIPIQVLVRHKKWQLFRERLITMAKTPGRGSSKKQGSVYQPLIHPDLKDIPAHHESKDRFQAMKNNLNLSSGSILDIGANFGFFCHKFENLGFDCYAIENELEIFEVAKKLKIAENKNFELINDNVLDVKTLSKFSTSSFDIVLSLSIFHHFLKNKQDYDALKSLLENLNPRVMFFEPHLPDESQMKNAYKNYSPEEFVDFIFEHTDLNESEKIHTSHNGRSLYKLSR